jgi:protein-S-isoprenylcysteine O-methyltransferase Ste14
MTDKGSFFLYAQVILFLLVLYWGSFKGILTNPFLIIVFLAGVGIIASALLKLGHKNYSPHPKPRETNELTTTGIYKYIKHPFYTGMALIGLCMVLSVQRLEILIVYIVFLIVQNIKADIEEEYLLERHKEYRDYQSKTKKFIPYLY